MLIFLSLWPGEPHTDKDVGIPRHLLASASLASSSPSHHPPKRSHRSSAGTSTTTSSPEQDADPLASTSGRGSAESSSTGGGAVRRKLHLSDVGGVSEGMGVSGGVVLNHGKEQSGLVC